MPARPSNHPAFFRPNQAALKVAQCGGDHSRVRSAYDGWIPACYRIFGAAFYLIVQRYGTGYIVQRGCELTGAVACYRENDPQMHLCVQSQLIQLVSSNCFPNLENFMVSTLAKVQWGDIDGCPCI